jgi:hypothetical protein
MQYLFTNQIDIKDSPSAEEGSKQGRKEGSKEGSKGGSKQRFKKKIDFLPLFSIDLGMKIYKRMKV